MTNQEIIEKMAELAGRLDKSRILDDNIHLKDIFNIIKLLPDYEGETKGDFEKLKKLVDIMKNRIEKYEEDLNYFEKEAGLNIKFTDLYP